MTKKPYTAEEEAMFFYWLGNRLFTTVLRGYPAGLKKPLSAARDYLRVQSVEEGVERDACQFLVDVASMGRPGSLSLRELFRKWSDLATWHPMGPQPSWSKMLADED